ncbi:nuclear export protein Noc3 [Lineolata rhizophorae]|uniref:Nucleolar complex-associated protein 3 n=1 Tax=Lineolata rhizophorae TaxID=578093 RepID=A0A6A6NX02_9PEZI|nr:nuclear export protein Noc3 [Lineolata rhizophorae]
MSRPAVKRRRVSPPAFDDAWSVEQDYEKLPRKHKQEKTANRLPIKTVEGWIEQPEAEQVTGEASDSFLDSDVEDKPQEPLLERKSRLTTKAPPRQQILAAKEELARLASHINEDPEEHAGSLRKLARVTADNAPNNATVKKLELAARMAVFKDVIPGYRIRPLEDDDAQGKLSKEVRKQRIFEQALIGSYKEYVEELAKHAKGGRKPDNPGLVSVAIACACGLLEAVPHFNFRGEVLKILVGKLSSRRVDDDFNKCLDALETLFREDEDGYSSFEAVQMLTKMMRARDYAVHESVLNTFLQLRLLSEFHYKASHDGVERPSKGWRGRKKGTEKSGKMLKEKREFRTKRQRKDMREQKVLEKAMDEADAAVGHEERERLQAEMLKLVFATYFRILKARTPGLMGAVLEGLAKYAHLINQDFFGDILEALKDLINSAEARSGASNAEEDGADVRPCNVTRESLLCVITAFALLQGQDASAAALSLHLDLSFFIAHLYRNLLPISLNADIERSAKSLHLPDPDAADDRDSSRANSVNVQTTVVLLLRSLSSALLPRIALRAVPPVRLAAFTKQLATVALQLPEKSCVAVLDLLMRVIHTHGGSKNLGALWFTEERKGDGMFDATRAEYEGSNPFATTVWEGEILRRHYAPEVREAASLSRRYNDS